MTLEEYLQRSLSEASVKSYLFSIKKYKQHNMQAAKYNYQKVMQYIEILRKSHSPKSIKGNLASIKKYYDYLIEIGKREDNPAKSINLRDAKENPIQLQDLFTVKELEELLKPRLERYPFLTKRNRIIMSLLVHQGLRVAEITTINISDVDLEKASLKVKGTGQTNTRNLPLEASQILLLHQYIHHDRNKLKTFRKDENALLLGKLGTPVTNDDIDYLISTYQKQSNKRLTATAIRQSVITNLFIKNNDLRVVQHFAGHKSPDTTAKYRQTGLDALKLAIDKLHPIR